MQSKEVMIGIVRLYSPIITSRLVQQTVCYKQKEKEQTTWVCSLKRWLPTLLRAAVVLLMWVRSIALCNRGRSCQASAEPLASYAEPQPTEEQSKPKALLLKLSSLIQTVHMLLAVNDAATYIDNPSKPPFEKGGFLLT